MKASAIKLAVRLCRARFLFAVVLGLGIGWAMSASLGVAVGYAIGGSVTVAFLAGGRRDCRRARS